MTQILFLSAGVLALVWLFVHLLLGGREIVAPAFAEDRIDPLVRDTLYICWHFTSVGILTMAVLFFLAAIGSRDLFAIVGTGLATGFVVAGIIVQSVVGQPIKKLPQGWLFLPIALLGGIGVLL